LINDERRGFDTTKEKIQDFEDQIIQAVEEWVILGVCGESEDEL